MANMGDALKKAGFAASESVSGKNAKFKAQEDLSEDYTLRAEKVIIELRDTMGKNYQNLTTSKIRSILTMVSEIYNDVVFRQDTELSRETADRIKYLKVRLVYECGREPYTIKPFVNKAGLIELIDGIGSSREKFIAFSRYMEALVAYHRFYDGKD